jgi:hypothetical protein
MRALWVGLLTLSACGASIEGQWVGKLECGGFPWDVTLVLEKGEDRAFVGDGTQERSFTNLDGLTTEIVITFTAEHEQASGAGEQLLRGDWACVNEVTSEIFAPGAEPEILTQGCTPGRFTNYAYTWDGEDAIAVDGPDGCTGDLSRR